MESNEPKKPSGFELSPTDANPETGKVTFDVKYKADFSTLYKAFKNLNKEYEKFLEYDEIRKDPKFKEIYKGLKYLSNQYNTHLRGNYPKQYSLLRATNENLLRELVQKRLKEMSATGAGAGAGTFTPGEGANYATPNAFNPNKKAKGAQNIYYYKLGWKPVDAEKLHKQAKGLEHKDLWTKKLKESTDSYINSLNLEDPTLKNFVETRISDFDKIEDKLNTLLPLLKSAKTDTMEYYKTNPDFKIKYGTDLAVDYLDDLITLFKEKK